MMLYFIYYSKMFYAILAIIVMSFAAIIAMHYFNITQPYLKGIFNSRIVYNEIQVGLYTSFLLSCSNKHKPRTCANTIGKFKFELLA